MIRTLVSVSSLLAGIGVLLMGLALLGTSLGVRAVREGYPDSTTGLIMASYFAGFIIGSWICPGMIRRIGPIRSYAALAAIAAVCTFLHALLVTPAAWAALRCAVGICLVGLYLVVESWLNSVAPGHRRGQVFAAYMMVTLGAHAFGQFLLLLDPAADLAAFGIAAAFFSLGLVPVALTRLPQPTPVEAPTVHLGQLIERAPLSLVGALVAGLVTSGFWGLGAVFATRSGLETGQIVTFMVTLVAGGVLLQWPVGHLSDRYDRRYVLLGVAVLGTLASLFAALAHGLGPRWLFASIFVVGGLIFTIYGLSVAYLNDRIHSAAVVDASRGILLVFGIGAFAGPMLAGLAMRAAGPVGLLYYAAFVLGAFAVYAAVAVRHTRPVPEDERTPFMPMNRTSQAVIDLDPRVEAAEAADASGAAGDTGEGAGGPEAGIRPDPHAGTPAVPGDAGPEPDTPRNGDSDRSG